MGEDNTSVIGYANSVDGLHISERLGIPAYFPRENFEAKLVPGGNSGCEDPRITRIGDMIYMLYTAFDGNGPPRVASTSIESKDFLFHRNGIGRGRCSFRRRIWTIRTRSFPEKNKGNIGSCIAWDPTFGSTPFQI